jgi:Tfp pilus assembly protein PilO
MKYLMPIIFIVAAIAGFFLYTNPQYQALKLKMADYQKIVEANNKATTLRAVRQKLSEDRNKIAEVDVDKITKMIPDSVENVGLIIDIDNIASKYGMRIRNTKINEAAAKSGTAVGPDARKYGAITISFAVTSSYENFLVFLRDLESSVRLVDLTGLTFSSVREGRYDFNVTLQTYWLK